ncbi:MAG TPA: TonB-dependent receptor [Caldimonas sp.]|nr:TonB-dependent receptor [Caldimonas sp.]
MTLSERAALRARACGRLAATVILVAAASAATAQSGDPAPAPPNAPAAATPTPPAAKTELDTVQITGSRPGDVQERRNSTAAKIVIGRDEIERFGDSTLGDVLKRLPGVTIQGRPGRGGAIRLRGLGNGYTQILLDGERVPPGFSLDSISPEQIERIEILRAPTAETGARAIAGTINIITRDGYNRRVNDIRLSSSYENSRVQPSASWTRNIAADAWTINYSLTGYSFNRDNSSTTTTVDNRLDDGALTLEQTDIGRVRVHGEGVHATGRLQWRSDGGVETLTLTPIFFYNRGSSHREGTLLQTVGAIPAPYDSSTTEGEFVSSYARLNAQWNHRLAGGGVLEGRAGLGQARQPSSSHRVETTGGVVSRTLDDSLLSHDTSFTLAGKLTKPVFDGHAFVSGAELESNRRVDTHLSLQNGQPLLTDFGDDVTASAMRYAVYAQDEWNLTPNWAAHAGLRWEGIATRGSVEQGQPDASNRSSVWTPLLHAVWKPDPDGRDQVRMSLTRSYRSPTLTNLIARPSLNARYPVPGPNTPTQPDRAGNPELRPELATGIDLAFERYLPGSGLVSANVFHRNLSNYLRSVTTLETVSWATSPRYVSRPQNVGAAMTEGIELEAKFRASELWPEAPRLDVRTNASFFRSRVRSVPGPDNRVDQQPDYTANVGLDYRLRGWPLLLGGNLNWTPGYLTRVSDAQSATIGRKLVADVYALWTFNPGLALRFTASNLAAADYMFGSSVDGPDLQGVPVRETSRTTAPTFVNVQVRLEIRL